MIRSKTSLVFVLVSLGFYSMLSCDRDHKEKKKNDKESSNQETGYAPEDSERIGTTSPYAKELSEISGKEIGFYLFESDEALSRAYEIFKPVASSDELARLPVNEVRITNWDLGSNVSDTGFVLNIAIKVLNTSDKILEYLQTLNPEEIQKKQAESNTVDKLAEGYEAELSRITGKPVHFYMFGTAEEKKEFITHAYDTYKPVAGLAELKKLPVSRVTLYRSKGNSQITYGGFESEFFSHLYLDTEVSTKDDLETYILSLNDQEILAEQETRRSVFARGLEMKEELSNLSGKEMVMHGVGAAFDSLEELEKAYEIAEPIAGSSELKALPVKKVYVFKGSDVSLSQNGYDLTIGTDGVSVQQVLDLLKAIDPEEVLRRQKADSEF